MGRPAHEGAALGSASPGEHLAEWPAIVERFGTTPWRRQLLEGLASALRDLRAAGCKRAYIDGSFVTVKEHPGDFDACWDVRNVNDDKLDPVFLDFSQGRVAQKQRFLGELFPAQLPEGATGRAFVDFFQVNKTSAEPKGILAIRLGRSRRK